MSYQRYLALAVMTCCLTACQAPELLEPSAKPTAVQTPSPPKSTDNPEPVVIVIPTVLPIPSPSPILPVSSLTPGPVSTITPLASTLPIATSTPSSVPSPSTPTANPDLNTFVEVLRQAFQNKLSNIQVKGSGTVSRLLADDNDGSRHQRFILSLSSGQTLLIAHNIDLAPGIAKIAIGDTVEFYGEYEWNQQGGVIHWTHQDPQNKHVAGWLKHKGQMYQ